MGISIGAKNLMGTGIDVGFSGGDGGPSLDDQFYRWKWDYDAQKEFAQSGVSWRIADAKAAGVHPVWALGGGGAAYAPQAAVGSSGGGDRWSIQGQDVSRAAQSTMSPEQRLLFELDLEARKLQVENLKLERAKLGGERVGNQAQVGPGMPSNIPGDMFAGDWHVTKPAERVSHDPYDVSSTASSASPFWEKFHVDDKGNTVWLPSGGKGTATESLEALSESWPMMYSVVSENMRRDPELVYKLRHLWPGGEMAAYVARMLDQGMQAVLNAQKRSRAAKGIARQWWERIRSDRAKSHGLK